MSAQERSLDVVARLKGAAEREAAAALQAAERRLSEEEARLAAMRAMLEEYQRGAFASGRPQQLRETRNFLQQLQSGLDAQAAVVERQRRVTEAARAHWISARLQRDALERLVEEREAADERRRDRIEQKQTDDRASYARERFVSAAR
ncbi:MAG TPA: flagellar export protein FliJ [Gammaproteobacteria bacterium]